MTDGGYGQQPQGGMIYQSLNHLKLRYWGGDPSSFSNARPRMKSKLMQEENQPTILYLFLNPKPVRTPCSKNLSRGNIFHNLGKNFALVK
ncbi:hypothetical protein [Vibrio cholerae]|uniref:hypothetical protein n=1 Tax=Vibrio cholerae TaxID=666 RepID=UPI0000ED83F9|nr:hypothetical protein [Vibrio cholerae]KNH48617.1 chemotaxis protein CheA [Vibrio cholerae V52]OFJ38818.1 hypothetical protein BFX33_17980 [Vibrio cholerae V52]WOR12409.1 hypothetical protein R4540_06245 [Vibrio cholerae V52]WOR12418.1 hypothetical protein R4540_06290 [Vibrio cholerae V52]